jgi:hypothetical protein
MKSVYFLGSKYWRDYLAAKLGENGGFRAVALDWSSIKSLSQAYRRPGAVVVVVGLGARVSPRRLAIWATLAAFWIRGRGSNRLVFYWIGTDVLSLNDNPSSRIYAKVTRLFRVKHICGAPWFVDELRQHGISAQCVLFPYDTEPAAQYADALLPAQPFKICTYLTSAGWKTLEGQRTLRIAMQTPNVRWTVMGMNANDIPKGETIPSNVAFTGWVDDPLAVQAQCHALLRLVQHDAFSGVVRDALAMRRIVLYSLPIAGGLDIGGKSDSEIAFMINKLATSSEHAVCNKVKDFKNILKPFTEQIAALRRALEE